MVMKGSNPEFPRQVGILDLNLSLSSSSGNSGFEPFIVIFKWEFWI